MYTGQCNIDEPDIIQFILVGKSLGVIGVLEESIDITTEDDVSEVHNDVNLETKTEQWNCTFRETINQKGVRLSTESSLPEKIEFNCNQCQAVFKSLKGLAHHINGIHKGVKYDCNNGRYRAISHSNLILHIQSIHKQVKYDCNQCNYRATSQTFNTWKSEVLMWPVWI